MTLNEYVENSIYEIFQGIAVKIATGEIDLDDYTEDECPGIPMAPFKAGNHLVNAWREFVGTES